MHHDFPEEGCRNEQHPHATLFPLCGPIVGQPRLTTGGHEKCTSETRQVSLTPLSFRTCRKRPQQWMLLQMASVLQPQADDASLAGDSRRSPSKAACEADTSFPIQLLRAPSVVLLLPVHLFPQHPPLMFSNPELPSGEAPDDQHHRHKDQSEDNEINEPQCIPQHALQLGQHPTT